MKKEILQPTKRQILRRERALAEYEKYKHENLDRQWIGGIWNQWKQQALVFGSTKEEAIEAADQAHFRIPLSENDPSLLS
ncbi:hypothetical protein HY085_02180 [Candidatus Gottesmanbacteria bacterium]|nr:hypothetical protein [Candidatus Gottesmanbacteria bacterium]